jgi:hypothetical protein
VDVPTVMIAAVTFAALVSFKKIPEPVLIAAAGIAGIELHLGT